MLINLKKSVVSKLFKIYFIEQKHREIINETFDKLQTQNKLYYTT